MVKISKSLLLRFPLPNEKIPPAKISIPFPMGVESPLTLFGKPCLMRVTQNQPKLALVISQVQVYLYHGC